MGAMEPRSPTATHARRPSARPAGIDADAAGRAWLALCPRGRLRDLESAGAILERTTSSAAFIRRLRETRPRLAILNVPPAGSADLLAAISERRQRATLRIVLLNEAEAISERLDALALGFDEALPTTIDAGELIGRIRLMLVGTRVPTTEIRQSSIAPGLHLDLAARRVVKDGEEIHLRPKEFSLLALLAADPGRVYTRDELVELVWGPGYRGNVRTVDVHVRWLRAKLEADPARPRHVVTVRGTGYRLDSDVD